jgi:hypothetical protein
VEAPYVVANLGACATFALGALGFFAPARVATEVGIAALGVDGRAEVRATYGGLFFAVGGLCMLAQDATVFAVAGVAWMGAACGRALSMLWDRAAGPRGVAGLAVEGVIGAALLAPQLVT